MPPLDWTNIELLRETSQAINRAVDKQIEEADTEGYRSHLGASVIGNECLRYLFYHFRWMHKESYPARMLRLFNNGHGFEARVRTLLKSIGFIFQDEDDKQLRFSAIGGHFGGSVDGIFTAPDWGIHEPTLLECKTSGTGAGFNNLDAKGLKVTKPQHYVQDCVYGRGFNLSHCLYVAENKNDSDWHFQLLNLDMQVAEEAWRKAEFIILAKEPPNKISNKRAFWLCNMCKMQPVCHDGLACDVNCRSCQHSTPSDNASWVCLKWNSTIPADVVPVGCAEHSPIQR